MPVPKKNKSHIKPTDGRKHNKGVKKGSRGSSKLTPAKLNKAKRARMELYAINAIREKFGSEEAVFEFIAEQALKGKQYYMTKLLDYAYGDPRDIDRSQLKEESKTPKIVFVNQNAPKEEIQEIEYEEDSEDTPGGEDGDTSLDSEEQEEISQTDTEEE